MTGVERPGGERRLGGREMTVGAAHGYPPNGQMSWGWPAALDSLQQHDPVAAVGVQAIPLGRVRRRGGLPAIEAVRPEPAKAPAHQLLVTHRVLIEGQRPIVLAKPGSVVAIPDGMDAKHRPGVLPAGQDEALAVPLPEVRARPLRPKFRVGLAQTIGEDQLQAPVAVAILNGAVAVFGLRAEPNWSSAIGPENSRPSHSKLWNWRAKYEWLPAIER